MRQARLRQLTIRVRCSTLPA